MSGGTREGALPCEPLVLCFVSVRLASAPEEASGPSRALAFVSSPFGMPAPRPSLGSLSGNDVGEKGATAIAAILNETKITKLKCAAAPYVRFRVSAH